MLHISCDFGVFGFLFSPKQKLFNGRNADICSDVAGPSSSGSGDFLLCTFAISPTTNTTGRHLRFDRDYNFHTAFRACYVIMHKVC